MGWEVPVNSTIEISAWFRFHVISHGICSCPHQMFPHFLAKLCHMQFVRFCHPNGKLLRFELDIHQKLTYTKLHPSAPPHLFQRLDLCISLGLALGIAGTRIRALRLQLFEGLHCCIQLLQCRALKVLKIHGNSVQKLAVNKWPTSKTNILL